MYWTIYRNSLKGELTFIEETNTNTLARKKMREQIFLISVVVSVCDVILNKSYQCLNLVKRGSRDNSVALWSSISPWTIQLYLLKADLGCSKTIGSVPFFFWIINTNVSKLMSLPQNYSFFFHVCKIYLWQVFTDIKFVISRFMFFNLRGT